MKHYKASVSFYFVVSIVLIISVIMSVTEIARINAQKLYLQIATDASIDSMSSLYHRKLYDYYNLYGVEYRTKEGLIDEYFDFIYPYFVDEDRYIGNWYVANIEKENINLEIKELVDENYLEKEIIEYMKYKMVGKTVEFFGKSFYINDESDFSQLVDEANEIFEEMKKKELYAEIHKRYFDFKNDIKVLEGHIKNITNKIEDSNDDIKYMASINVSGSESNAKTVARRLDKLNNNINNLINELNSFQDKMNKFRDVVLKSKSQYIEDVASGKYEYNDEIKQFIELEFERFINFVDEDSPMNNAVEETKSECNAVIRTISEHNIELQAYVAEFERIEDDLRYERSLRGDEHDSAAIRDLLDEKRDLQDTVASSLKDIKVYYKDLEIKNINAEVSTSNHSEKENILNKIIGFKDGILLNLVLDNDKIDAIDSEVYNYSDFSILSNVKNVSIEKLLLGEYAIHRFHYYNKELNNEETKSNSTNLEVERLITGERNDKSALSLVINKILLMRIAMNVLHIYSNAAKREGARSYAYLLFAGFSPLLAEVMALLIITAWGTAQGLADIKKLLNNKRVSFMHTPETWTLAVESIINIGKNNTLVSGNDENDSGFALSYKDYLRLLLLLENQSEVDDRMASIIERNIKKEQDNFDFEKLVYSFLVDNKFLCRHYFTNFVYVAASDEKLYEEYILTTSAYRCYYDD